MRWVERARSARLSGPGAEDGAQDERAVVSPGVARDGLAPGLAARGERGTVPPEGRGLGVPFAMICLSSFQTNRVSTVTSPNVRGGTHAVPAARLGPATVHSVAACRESMLSRGRSRPPPPARRRPGRRRHDRRRRRPPATPPVRRPRVRPGRPPPGAAPGHGRGRLRARQDARPVRRHRRRAARRPRIEAPSCSPGPTTPRPPPPWTATPAANGRAPHHSTVAWRLAEPRPERVVVATAGTADLPVADECAATLAAHGFEPIRADRRRRRRRPPAARLGRRAGRRRRHRGRRRHGGRAGQPRRRHHACAGRRRAHQRRLRGQLRWRHRAARRCSPSCAAGLTVVGIDNGFGAACAVLRMLK